MMKKAVRLMFMTSMGPRSFDRGETGRTQARMQSTSTSMGPRSFDRGERISASSQRHPRLHFNGAAVI